MSTQTALRAKSWVQSDIFNILNRKKQGKPTWFGNEKYRTSKKYTSSDGNHSSPGG